MKQKLYFFLSLMMLCIAGASPTWAADVVYDAYAKQSKGIDADASPSETLNGITITYGSSEWGATSDGITCGNTTYTGLLSAKSNSSVSNNQQTVGCIYLEPTENGTVSMAVIVNSDKKFYIYDETESEQITDFNPLCYIAGCISNGNPKKLYFNTSDNKLYEESTYETKHKLYGTVTFDVTKNHKYSIGVAGSKIGFYGLVFSPTTTPPAITTDLSATADAYVGEATTLSVVANGATSFQWYKASGTSVNTEADKPISGATSASYSYTASAAGTEYLYCAATNAIGTVYSTVCAVTATAPDYLTVTFGLTRPLTVDPNDATKGTMGDNVWNTANNTFTLTEVYGSDVTIDGVSRNYTIDDVTYAATRSYKKSTKLTDFDESQFTGYSFVIPDGKKLDITKVDARLSDASNCTWTWKIVVQDADKNILWGTGNRTTSSFSTTTTSISDNSLATALAGLVSGTYYAKIYFYQGGTTKCNTIDLTFTGNLKDADPTVPTVTIASEQVMVKDAENTISAVVQAYPAVTAYQWYSCDDAQGTNPVAVEGQTTSTLSITPTAEGTLYYYLAATNSAGTTNSDVCTVTVVAEAEFSDFSAIINNGAGTLITADEISGKSTVSFGISVDNEGNTVRVAADSPMAFATVSGKYHSEHGLEGFKTVVKVPGNAKIKLGTCNWGGNVTIKNAEGETVAIANTNNGTCYHGNTSANKVTVYYEGGATTLTIEGGGYVPFISIASVSTLYKYNVTFKNGEETVATKIVYNDGIEAQPVGTLPSVTAEAGMRFRGWYEKADGSEGKITATTVPSSDVTYYAVFMNTPVATAGYYTPSDGLELANVLEYIEETSAASAKIFLKNGTYTLPRGASKHYTHRNTQTGATLWEGDAYDPITYLKSSDVSFIGQSRDGVIITNNVPNTSDYVFAGQYGNANIYEGIGCGDVIQIAGSVSGLYWQDLTVSTGMADGYGRDIAIQDKGTKNIYKNVGLHGYQDTWTSNNDNGLYYFEGGVVRGRTDYLCGKGDIYFNGVELRQLKGGYAAVPSKPANIGWVFKNCVINGDDSDVDGNYTLGRPWGSGTPVAVFIDTKMNVKPSAIGWNEMSGGWPARFAEYNSVDANGNAISLSGRKTTFASSHTNNPVLTEEEAAAYSDMDAMYGDWNPTQYTVQATVENVTLSGKTLSWESEATAFLIEKDGAFVALTEEKTYDVSNAGRGIFTVRAANARGGFGEAVEMAGAGTLTWNIATNVTTAPAVSSMVSTFTEITSSDMGATFAATTDASQKVDLTVKIACSEETPGATMTFNVPEGYAFVPYIISTKLQPVDGEGSKAKILINGENEKTVTLKKGEIRTFNYRPSNMQLTGTVTIDIYCYADGTTYRFGTPVTVTGQLVELPAQSVTVSISNAGWATLYTDKALDFSNSTLKAYVATVNDKEEDRTVTLIPVTEVPANVGVVLQGAAGDYTIPVIESAAIPTNGNLTGDATKATAYDAYDGYTLYILAPVNGGKDVQFVPCNGGNIAAGKAFFKLATSQSGQAKAMKVVFASETTGISTVNAGVTVPVKKIQNGQLVIEKNGKTYNAAGQLK